MIDGALEDTIRHVMADILNIEAAKIGEHTSMQNTEGWDSANHIQLVLALEQEFSISFDVSEFESMLSFPDVVAIVQSKL